MSRVVFAERREGRVVLLRPDSGKPLEGPDDGEALLISRMDCDVHVLEVPPAAAKEPAGYLRYRLPALYPGRPEASELDYRQLRLGRRGFAVLFVAGAGVLQGYREAARGRPLLLPFSLFQPLVATGRGEEADGVDLFSYWHTDWIDCLLVPSPRADGGEAPKAFLVRRSGSAADEIAQLLARTGRPAEQVRWVFFAGEAEREELRDRVRAAGSASVDALPIGEAFAALRRPAGLFAPRGRAERLPRGVRVQLLVLAILAAAFLLARRAGDREEDHARRLQGELAALEAQVGRAVPLQKEAEKLEEQLRSLQRRRVADPYRVLAALQSVLQGEVRVRSFQLEKNAFQLEAVAVNPLRLMEAFGRSGAFEEVRMVQVIPLKDEQGELFRLTGRLRAAGGAP